MIGNTELQIHFSARDDLTAEYLTRLSGQTTQPLLGEAVSDDGSHSLTSRDVFVPRIGPEEITYLNHNEGVAAVQIAPGSGLARFTRVFFQRCGFCVGRQSFEKLSRMPWPAGNRFTVTACELEATRPAPEADRSPSAAAQAATARADGPAVPESPGPAAVAPPVPGGKGGAAPSSPHGAARQEVREEEVAAGPAPGEAPAAPPTDELAARLRELKARQDARRQARNPGGR